MVVSRMRPSGNIPTVADTAIFTFLPILVTNGIGIWTAAVGSTGSETITVHYGFLPYDVDVILLELANTSTVTNPSTATGSGTSAAINQDGINVTVPFPLGSDSWQGIVLTATSPSSGTISLLYLSLTDYGRIYAGPTNPPASWHGVFGSWSELLTLASLAPGPPSGDVVTDICVRAGLSPSQIDVSLLTNANINPNVTVPGYLIEQPRAALEILKVLMQAYFFDGCEEDGAMRWIPRGLASAMSIPESDIGLLEDKSELEESLAQAQDLPLQVTVVYNDPALDYQQNKQLKGRNTRIVRTRQNIVLQIPMTMGSDFARQVAEKALYIAWLERSSYKMNLWRALYLQLSPTDVVTFTYQGLTFTMRAVSNSLGQGFLVELQGVNENSNNYLSSTKGGTLLGYTTTPLTLVGPTQLWLFDIPLVEDTDANPSGTGFYFAMGSAAPDWAGGLLYDSSDNSTFADNLATASSAVTFGYATTTLGSPMTPWAWDTVNTLTVKLSTGQFAGDTQLNVLNGSNEILVGTGSSAEIVAFQNAVHNSDGTWTISVLLRGLRGTEAACSTHGSNELVILIPSGLQRVEDPLSVLGVPEYYKAVTVGQDISTAGSQQSTITGKDLAPYAPAGIGGTVDGSANIAITWVRRTRIGGEADWADGVSDVPLSEDSELYDVDIMNGSTVVRTISNLTAPTAIYTAAMQNADFGSTQTSVTARVYQKSGQVGRGYRATGIAPTPGAWPVPWPAVASGGSGGAGGFGQFYVNGS